MKKILITLVALSLFISVQGQIESLPVPVVTGPVVRPGTIFYASLVDLSKFGYVEEEYFLEGMARYYSFDAYPQNAVLIDTIKPYKTRVIVRRPAKVRDFTGTVLVEWLNVSNMHDADSDWTQLYEHLMRSGYVWIGVSAQRDGIHGPTGLRSWNPGRYGTLDVTADSTLLWDQLSFDIFTQAVASLSAPQKNNLLGKFKTERVVASGHSQSAILLTAYYNCVQPINGIIDGFIIRGGGDKLRTDIGTPVFKINAESDLVLLGMAINRQPDTEHLVTWEVAGTSHADKRFSDYFEQARKRDFGFSKAPECSEPLCSLIPFNHVYSAALEHMVRWIKESVPPPAGIPISVMQMEPMVALARDTLRNVLGGIRVPQFDVPVAMNIGINLGEGYCVYYGTHQEFTPSVLKVLYPTHQDYLKKFKASVENNLKAGYILREDTLAMLNEARGQATLWK